MKARDLLMIAALVGANSAFVSTPVTYASTSIMQDQGGAGTDADGGKKSKKGGKKGGKKDGKKDDKKGD
jgi:hypothetical protein